MAVEICVSGEELRKAMEMVTLVGSASGGKKKDDADIPGQNVLHIVAVSPKKDKKYLIALGAMNVMEQVEYFFEGVSYTNNEPVDVYLELKRFAALARTFTGDVNVTFEENEVVLNAGASKYTLTVISTSMPSLTVPDGGVDLPSSLLEKARDHCSVAVPKSDGNPAMTGIQIKLSGDGDAVCWGANRSCAAKLVVPSVGVWQQLELVMKPECMKHVVDFAEGESVCISKGNGGIFASGRRFRYRCSMFCGSFPDCNRMASGKQEIKRIKIAKNRLLAAIIRAGVMAGEDDNAFIKLCSDAESLYVEGVSVAGVGMEQVPLESSEGKDDASIYFPAGRLARLVSACQGEELTIGSNGSLQPFFIRSSGSDSFYLLAPVRGGR